MSMENGGGMILTGKTEELEEKPAPLPLCPQISRGANPGLRGERPDTNRLSNGTAQTYRHVETPGTHCAGGWVGPRAGLDTLRLEEKSFRLCRGSNLDRPVVQPVARHCSHQATRFTVWYVQ
jgi:hypothetical protein